MNLLEEKIYEFTQDEKERDVLNQRFGCVEDFEHAVKRNLMVWTVKEYKASLEGNGFDEEEIESALKRADVIDGYIVEYTL